MDKKIKNLKYKDLMEKLKKAVNNDFYYEAIFIEYAIFEDRTSSLLKHSKLSLLDYKGEELNLNSKLKKIERSARFYNDKYVSKHINQELLSKIHIWKNKRNILIHDLIKTNYNDEDVKDISLDGYNLIKIINNKSTLVNKYFDNLLNQKD